MASRFYGARCFACQSCQCNYVTSCVRVFSKSANVLVCQEEIRAGDEDAPGKGPFVEDPRAVHGKGHGREDPPAVHGKGHGMQDPPAVDTIRKGRGMKDPPAVPSEAPSGDDRELVEGKPDGDSVRRSLSFTAQSSLMSESPRVRARGAAAMIVQLQQERAASLRAFEETYSDTERSEMINNFIASADRRMVQDVLQRATIRMNSLASPAKARCVYLNMHIHSLRDRTTHVHPHTHHGQVPTRSPVDDGAGATRLTFSCIAEHEILRQLTLHRAITLLLYRVRLWLATPSRDIPNICTPY